MITLTRARHSEIQVFNTYLKYARFGHIVGYISHKWDKLIVGLFKISFSTFWFELFSNETNMDFFQYGLQNVLRLILKSPLFVPIGANQTKILSNPDTTHLSSVILNSRLPVRQNFGHILTKKRQIWDFLTSVISTLSLIEPKCM